MLVAADLQRPAAIDQLVTLGKQLDLPVYHSREAKTLFCYARERLSRQG